ncbi:MAG: hypothetical protein KatS3mg068_1829 [Candidatus Sericytochromatia bacterium]|nr:MAG: hypothetical protein KatS3mg068_1829 [Candidatus Sericytochromatia bacterium]
MYSCLKSNIEITGIEKNIGEMIINRSQKFYNNTAIQEKKK